MNDRIEDAINELAGRWPLLDHVMTFAATSLIYVIILAVPVLWFWRTAGGRRAQQQYWAGAAAVAVLGALAIGAVLGLVHTAARPFVADADTHQLIGHAATNGFPSDHATVAFAVGGTLVWWRRLLGSGLLLAALIVGVARIYTGVHWPADVAAGAAAGLLAGALAARCLPVWARMHRFGGRFLPAFLVAASDPSTAPR